MLSNSFHKSRISFATHPMLHCENSIAESCRVLGRFTHGLLPAPAKKLSRNLLALNRARIRVVTRMLTFYNGINNHMCRICRRSNPLCSRCKEGCDTPSSNLLPPYFLPLYYQGLSNGSSDLSPGLNLPSPPKKTCINIISKCLVF